MKNAFPVLNLKDDTVYTQWGQISHVAQRCKCSQCVWTHSSVWAEGLVNSHILLGVDAAVSSQLVSL